MVARACTRPTTLVCERALSDRSPLPTPPFCDRAKIALHTYAHARAKLRMGRREAKKQQRCGFASSLCAPCVLGFSVSVRLRRLRRAVRFVCGVVGH